MPYIATQIIASGYGTFHIGDEVAADLPEPIADAWLAAGLIEPAPATTDATAPVPRVVTAPTPQRRFVEDASAPAPETATTGPKG